MGGKARSFPETLWTILLQARDLADPRRQGALDDLIRAYWKPIYFAVRRRGIHPETAKDLTQEFFTTFLEKDYLRLFDSEKGKFKTYLQVALSHFLSHQQEKKSAQKRGGTSTVWMNSDEIETQVAARLQRQEDPEAAFRRDWALNLIERAMRRLETEFTQAGRSILYQTFTRYLSSVADRAGYATIATSMGISETDVRNYLHRARARLRQLILSSIREYARDESEAEQEIQELFRSLG